MTAQTQQIALEYSASGDLAAARGALADLDVANANQWLSLVAETSISEGDAPEVTDALVTLALDLGVASPVLDRYAVERELGRTPARQTPTSDQTEPATQAPIQNQVADAIATADGEEAEEVDPEEVEPEGSDASGESGAETNVPVQEDPTEEDSAGEDPAETEEIAEDAATATPTPTDTPVSPAEVVAVSPMNVRAGPSTSHPIVGALQAASTATILSQNPNGDWWRIELADGTLGWIYAPLVETTGNVSSVSVAEVVPTPPPATPTPVPQPTATPAPAQAEQPAPEEPVQEEAPPPAAEGPVFTLVEQRLWDVEENGGFLAGDSVNCGEKQQLVVIVEDANGNPLNGVTVQAVYRNDTKVTGDKGPGTTEFVMNTNGDDVVVLRDVDGRDAISDRASGNTARTYDIPFDQLIQGRFCRDDASCQAFVDTYGCFGHFSWTVRFRRNY